MLEVLQSKAIIMDGKSLSHQMLEKIKTEISENKYDPRLAAIIIGEDKGSYTYQHMKEQKCAEVGIRYSLYAYPKPPDLSTIADLISKQNADSDITGGKGN